MGAMASVISIARLGNITGASLRALRHYEAVGLLSPIRSPNRGRWFTPEQAAVAETIVFLRRAEVPIEEIRHILSLVRSEDRARAVTAALEAKAAELEGRLADVRRALAEAATGKRTTRDRSRDA